MTLKEKNKLAKRRSRKKPKIRDNERLYYQNVWRQKANENAKKRRCDLSLWPKEAIRNIKHRAKKQNVEFSIGHEDLVVPEFCPVLGIPLKAGQKNYMRGSSPSVDRFDNSKGYTRDNVRVISYRANRLKCDATIEELKSVIKYMEGSQ